MRILFIFSVVIFYTHSLFSWDGEWQQTLRSQNKKLEILPNVFYGQFGQDKFIYESYFKDKKDGVFVEFGAGNGVFISNSLFFEKTLGWTGICVEPIPFFYNQLIENRNAICINGCISDKERVVTFLQVGNPDQENGRSWSGQNDAMLWSGILEYMHENALKRINTHIGNLQGTTTTFPVQCYLLCDILDQNNITHIDYLSIDVECGEFEILKSIDFSKYDIDVIGVEGNFQGGIIKNLLEEKGYDLVTYKGDYIYKKKYD